MGRVAHRKYSIGLKLSTFAGTDREDDVMSCLEYIKDDLPEQITIKLWYNEGEIKSGIIGKFMKKWGDLLAEYGSQMYCLNDRTNRTFDAWFNVFSRDDASKLFNIGRFQYYLDGESSIETGIFSFLNVVKFHCKTGRFDDYQKKRNKYEGRNSRKS